MPFINLRCGENDIAVEITLNEKKNKKSQGKKLQ